MPLAAIIHEPATPHPTHTHSVFAFEAAQISFFTLVALARVASLLPCISFFGCLSLAFVWPVALLLTLNDEIALRFIDARSMSHFPLRPTHQPLSNPTILAGKSHAQLVDQVLVSAESALLSFIEFPLCICIGHLFSMAQTIPTTSLPPIHQHPASLLSLQHHLSCQYIFF